MDDRERPTRRGSEQLRDGRGWPRRRSTIVRATWTVVALSVALLAVTGVADRRGAEYADGVFQQALVTFAVARGLDAAISVAQGTELAVQPAGLGVTLSAGELLDPINDLVEQFSWVMLVATTSLGVQSLLLRMSAWRVLTLLLVLVLAADVVWSWWGRRSETEGARGGGDGPAIGEDRAGGEARGGFAARLGKLLRQAVIVLLVLRFTMPVLSIGSALIFDWFLAPAQAASVEELRETSSDIRDLEHLDESPRELRESGVLGRLGDWFSGTVESLDVRARLQAFQDRIAGAVEEVIGLIAVFTLQTVLLPIAFLWALPRVVGAAVRRLT